MALDRLVGTTLAGRFRLVRLLGAGAMGRVYLAEHVRLRRRYAIKILLSTLAEKTTFDRFRNEAEAASRLSHPNVASVVDHGTTETGIPYLVMELAEGEGLGDMLDRRGALPAHEALAILRQIALGLAHAHGCGLVHRDLKPDNVILEKSDGRARILDFGLAILPELGTAGRFTARGVAIGSPAFMAPEQARAGAIDARTDLFALGVMLFLMVTGEMPYSGADVAEIVRHNLVTPTPSFADRAPRVPPMPAVEALCRKLMNKRPEDRPASATEVVAMIDDTVERTRVARNRARRFAWFGPRSQSARLARPPSTCRLPRLPSTRLARPPSSKVKMR